MGKTISATFDGTHLTPDEVLQLPPNTRIKVIIESEENTIQGDNGGIQTLEPTEMKSEIDISQQKNNELIDLLHSWRQDENTEEQRETWEFLKHALEHDRLSDRRLFP